MWAASGNLGRLPAAERVLEVAGAGWVGREADWALRPVMQPHVRTGMEEVAGSQSPWGEIAIGAWCPWNELDIKGVAQHSLDRAQMGLFLAQFLTQRVPHTSRTTGRPKPFCSVV
ncbi:hypothetical protein NDU88_005712 [Pleurodeles waltl]|uniref:Uncharacterized protein n=1 Tax=Pleurodeles waltl TaxID=8319 RepID=A0AAV7MBE4_PLEWA|nr:hypothetical protein NDU88_005712 [Pleurodeles waltl]